VAIPVLLICFNRPETFFQVLVSLRGLDNPIYVWIDGARTDRDARLAKECSNLISKESTLNIIEINHNVTNYGNTQSIPFAIEWVFKHVDRVVIIEDDVILSKDFFHFADSVLALHSLHRRIAGVSALNSVPNRFISNPDQAFRYSTYASVWGWAITKDSWLELRELLLIRIPIIKLFPKSARNFAAKLRWQSHYFGIANNLPVSWDYRLQLALFSLEKFFVIPNCNYALNVGFGEDATNTRNRPEWVPREYGKLILFNTEHVTNPTQDLNADNWVAKNMHHTKNIYWFKTIFRKCIKLNFKSK
jgi:hypothetical protein